MLSVKYFFLFSFVKYFADEYQSRKRFFNNKKCTAKKTFRTVSILTLRECICINESMQVVKVLFKKRKYNRGIKTMKIIETILIFINYFSYTTGNPKAEPFKCIIVSMVSNRQKY